MKTLTQADLMELLGLAKQTVSEGLISVGHIEIKQGIKHYRLIDLPQSYQERLAEVIDVAEYMPERRKPTLAPGWGTVYETAPEEKQKDAARRMAAVLDYQRRPPRQNVDKWVEAYTEKNREDAAAIGLTKHKLMRWLKKVEEAKPAGVNALDVLTDVRGSNRSGATKLTEEQQGIVIRSIVDRKNRPNARAIHNSLVARYGKEKVPSYDVVGGFIKRWIKENASFYEFADDPDKWKNTRLAAFGSYSEGVLYPNQVWELDSTPADVMTSDGKRYMVMAAIDVYSRRVVFHLDERSSSYSLGRLLRKAILKLGIPETVITDNGKDYVSKHFDSMCLNLGITQKKVPPFSGDAKPHVERVFRTLSHGLFEELPGYIGHSVSERQKIEHRKSMPERLAKQEAFRKQEKERKGTKSQLAGKFLINKKNIGIVVEVSLISEELAEWIDRWNEQVYEKRVHRGDGMNCTPLEKWSRNHHVIDTVPNPMMLDILLGESHTKKVGKKGIRHENGVYAHVQLAYHVGEYVRILCPDDAGKVMVYTMDFQPVCVALDHEKLGLSRQYLREGKRISSQIMRDMAKALRQMEEFHEKFDPTMREVIGVQEGHIPPLEALQPKAMMPKQTEMIESVSKTVEEEVKAKEPEVDENGRPLRFDTLTDRIYYCLSTGDITEKDQKIIDKYEDITEMVRRRIEAESKAG